MWPLKKEWFSGVENMTIVTPSEWLAGLVKQSFLKEYSVRIINNGINLDVFRPTLSDFKATHNIIYKKMVLGVASGWTYRKGLDVFIKLSEMLNPDIYQIVLVGTDSMVDKQLPPNIISIHKTQNQEELAEIYTAADVFVNPTREENFPTVNIEALACGTPIVTFKTGGCTEIIDETTGVGVACGDIDSMKDAIVRVCAVSYYAPKACVQRAEGYAMWDKFAEYCDLFEAICEKKEETK